MAERTPDATKAFLLEAFDTLFNRRDYAAAARFWSADYEWNAHRKHAVAAGLDPAIPAAIEAGRRPEKLTPDEALVYDLVGAMAEWVPDLRGTVMLPGVGHWTQQEQPAEVNAALLEFLSAVG